MATATESFGTYNIRSQSWSVRCSNGASISKGLGKLASAKVMRLNVAASKTSSGAQKGREMLLEFNLTGFELSAELGKDLLESTVGISVARTTPDISNSVPVYLNTKNGNDLMTHDFLGPCALITYSAGELTVIKDGIKKYAGKTFLLLNMGAVVADRSRDWLTRVVDATDGKSTLGGCFKAFNKDGSIFNNARAAIRLETTDFSAAVKAKAAGVGLFSGIVTMRSFK